MTSYVKIKMSKHKPIIVMYRSFHMPKRGRIFDKYFKTTEKDTFKKERMKDEHIDVARTRKC